jgi:broad specificity phosphatase PhoE
MRHGDVAYFDAAGRPVHPDGVRLTEAGREEAQAAAEMLAGVEFDRVLTSGLPRTLDTAAIVAPGREPEIWPELRELEGGRLDDIPEDLLEASFTRVFDGVIPEETRFLGGETIGALFDRVLPAVDRLLAADDWDVVLAVLHGAVNRAIISYALTGRRTFLGNFEQSAACVNVIDVGEDWIVRAVNVTAYDHAHRRGRLRNMEELWQQFRSI